MQSFYSILNENSDVECEDYSESDGSFIDLSLDQIFDKLFKSTDEFDFGRVLYHPLKNASDVIYRQKIMHDFDDENLREFFENFSNEFNALESSMNEIQAKLKSQSVFQENYEIKLSGLGFSKKYVSLIEESVLKINDFEITSDGLKAFCDYLKEHSCSVEFQTLKEDTESLVKQFQDIHFALNIDDRTIKLRQNDGYQNLNQEVDRLFSRFKQEEAEKNHRDSLSGNTDPNVDREILNLLSSFEKHVFSELDRFIKKHVNFLDETICKFCHEVRFYLSWEAFIDPVRREGLKFCYPGIVDSSSRIFCNGGFDLALSRNLYFEEKIPVTNDFYLEPKEKIIVVTGPNQGGKTTFARSVGQLFYLSSLGLSVPGESADIFLSDHIFTHFNMEENTEKQDSKLHNELLRLKNILDNATDKSTVIINEIFASTTLKDALDLGRMMMEKLNSKKCTVVFVTFLDELASFDENTVSMVSGIDEEKPGERTFKLTRRKADGLAFAENIAKKYHLTYEELNRRLSK